MELTPKSPPVLELKKGAMLFIEGEKSRAMYLLKSGSIRLFMKKGDSNIEIDTIRPGEILGELAFLDGNPRSVSGEAITECVLVEISGPTFIEALGRTPEWFKILLRTVVGRLRAVNSRLRHLEASNVVLDYSEKERGGRGPTYQFVSYAEFSRAVASLLLLINNEGIKGNGPFEVDTGRLNKYLNSVMSLPSVKASAILEILAHSGFVQLRVEKGLPRIFVKDPTFLGVLLGFLAEQSQLEPEKRTTVSIPGFAIMSRLYLMSSKLTTEEFTKISILNIGPELKTHVKEDHQKLHNEDAGELRRLGLILDLQIKSDSEVYVTLQPEKFTESYKLLKIVVALKTLNEQKRNLGTAA